MPNVSQAANGNRELVAVDPIARRQWGVVARDQLEVNDAALSRAVRSGRLHRLARGVYSTVEWSLLSDKGRFTAALFAAGRGSALSHSSAAWWLKLSDWRPPILTISSPLRRQGMSGTCIYRDRRVDVFEYNDVPVTSVPQTLLDIAAAVPFNRLRRALAEAEFHHHVQPIDLVPILRQGARGSAQLRVAIKRHMPKLARCRTELERDFLVLCERFGVPLPEPNHPIGLKTVDMVWPEFMLAVELHGVGHEGDRRGVRDATRQLHARREGYRTTEFWYDQIYRMPEVVAEDVIAMTIGA